MFLNSEFLIVPLKPFQKIAPPLRLAVLLINVKFSMCPFSAPSSHATAPPLISATLFSKLQSVNETSEHLASFVASKNTAPPRFAAVLFLKSQSRIIPSEPAQIIAPPEPPVVFVPL